MNEVAQIQHHGFKLIERDAHGFMFECENCTEIYVYTYSATIETVLNDFAAHSCEKPKLPPVTEFIEMIISPA